MGSIRRSDLVSSPPPPSPDADTQAQLRARLEEIYGNATLIFTSAPEVVLAESVVVPEGAEEEFEFRLFENKDGDEVEAQKIVLRDIEKDGTGEGGFISLRDPRTFIVQKAVGEQKAQFEDVAVSGETVLVNARKRAWGLEVPWRVRVLRVVGNRMSETKAGSRDVFEERKKRPGKKRRIILRGRKKSRDEMVEKRRVELESKEEAQKEKRIRRNREKKVKRRLKEKAKKSSEGYVIPGPDSSAFAQPTVND